MSDKDYPYCIGDFACSPCAPDGYNKTICGPPPGGWAHPCYAKDSCKAKLDKAKFVTKVVGWAQLAPGLNETEMASQLYHHGPISIAIDARTLQFYIFGIVSPLFCSSDPNKADHAVLVTGYGTEEDMLLQETPFWNVKVGRAFCLCLTVSSLTLTFLFFSFPELVGGAVGTLGILQAQEGNKHLRRGKPRDDLCGGVKTIPRTPVNKFIR